jgi:hypothetical protein
VKPIRVLAVLLVAVGVFIVAELAAGALDFGETRIADPCTTEASFEGGGIDGAISGAACELGASREELVLSFVPSTNASDVRWDKETINRALRAGVEQAAEDTAGDGLAGAALAVLLKEILADPLAWILSQSL